MSSQLKYRGSRWWVPGYLETPAGPWGTQAGFHNDPVAGWKAKIDWHADHGLNLIIADVAYSLTDRIYLGWAYHYLLDFKRWPHAGDLFSDDFRRRNLDTLSAIFAHAKNRGVLCLVHHFNFMAPRRMAAAEGWAPRYTANEADWIDGGLNIDPMRLLVHNCCWNHPGYQEFLKYCWRETCRLLPDLGGFLVTCGEANLGHFPTENDDTYRYYSDARYVDTTRHFIDTYVQTVTAAGRKPVVRCWGVEGAPHRMPQGVTYLIKHQMFDCVDAPGDDLVRRWVDNGHDMWVEAEFYGENAGPILWNNARYRKRMAEDIHHAGVHGYVSHLNSAIEVQLMDTPSARLGFECFHAALQDPSAADDKPRWIKLLAESFGADAERVYDAMELISHGILIVSKVAHRLGEGYAFGWWPTFTVPLAGMGNLGQTNGTAPVWYRQDMATVKEYIDYLQTNHWEPGCLDKVRAGRKCPIEELAESAEAAEQAEAILAGLAARVKPDAREEWRTLRSSAALSAAQSRMLENACRVKVLFNAIRAAAVPAQQKDLATQCLAAIDAAESAGARLREWVIQVPHNHSTGYKLCESMANTYRTMIVQLHPYRRELQRLLTGSAWTLSRYELTWKTIELDEVATQPHIKGDGVPLAERNPPWPQASQKQP